MPSGSPGAGTPRKARGLASKLMRVLIRSLTRPLEWVLTRSNKARPPDPPEALPPPRPAADPPQPQHVTQHHHGSRGRRLLRRSGSLCGHRCRSLSTAAPPRAACSLALPPSTACSSPWEGSPSTMQLPPPSTQHPMVWCQSARGSGSQQASQPFCGQLLTANAALSRETQTSPRAGLLRRHWRFGWPVRGLFLRS